MVRFTAHPFPLHLFFILFGYHGTFFCFQALYFPCTTCTKSFTSKPDLYDHIDKCSQESSQNVVPKKRFKISKPFKCDNCSAKFSSKNLLGNHTIDFHSDPQEIQEVAPIEKPRNYKLVEKPRNLKFKPFKCGTCKAKFSARVNLNNHMMTIHGAERRFGNHCTFCSTSFVSKIGKSSL